MIVIHDGIISFISHKRSSIQVELYKTQYVNYQTYNYTVLKNVKKGKEHHLRAPFHLPPVVFRRANRFSLTCPGIIDISAATSI